MAPRFLRNSVLGCKTDKSPEEDLHTFQRGRERVYNYKFKVNAWDFPGGAVVKNPPSNAGDTGLTSGLGRSHMPWSN